MKRIFLLVVAVWLGFAGCRRKHQQTPPDPIGEVFRKQAQEEGLSRAETEGKRLFAHYCATCHGGKGEGDGQNAYNLDPKPPEFQQSLQAHAPPYWRHIIEGGSAAVGRSPLCPPWGRSLSAREIDALIVYLAALERAASPTVLPEQAPRVTSPS